jgi:hypothetical protein
VHQKILTKRGEAAEAVFHYSFARSEYSDVFGTPETCHEGSLQVVKGEVKHDSITTIPC